MTTNENLIMTPPSITDDKNVKYHLVEAEEIEPTSTQLKKNPRMKKGKVHWSQFPLNVSTKSSSPQSTASSNSSNSNYHYNKKNNSNHNEKNMNINKYGHKKHSNNTNHNSSNNNNNISTTTSSNNNNNQNIPHQNTYHNNKKNHHRNRGGRGGGKWRDRNNKRIYQDQQQLQKHNSNNNNGYYQGVYIPQVDPKITVEYAKQQVEYYLTPDNLVRDTFLRQHMDVDGYVPVAFIANFQSVYSIHQDYPSLLESLKSSEVVEMDNVNEKIRPKYTWQQWLWPNSSGGYGLPRYIKMTDNSGDSKNSVYNTSSLSPSSGNSTMINEQALKGNEKVIEPSPEDDVEPSVDNENIN